MDFLRFLKAVPQEPDTNIQTIQEIPVPLETKPQSDVFSTPIKPHNKLFNVTKSYAEVRTEIEQNHTNQVLKRGDFVRIVYLKGSALNTYKGYNGEIKQYTRDAATAYIVLEAMNSSKSICFPIEHFIKVDYNSNL